jgi:hypothetical protein
MNDKEQMAEVQILRPNKAFEYVSQQRNTQQERLFSLALGVSGVHLRNPI